MKYTSKSPDKNIEDPWKKTNLRDKILFLKTFQLKKIQLKILKRALQSKTGLLGEVLGWNPPLLVGNFNSDQECAGYRVEEIVRQSLT